MTAHDSAHWFRFEQAKPINPVPIPDMEKGPNLPDWPDLRFDKPEDLARYFNGAHQNVGVLTGPENLTDVDYDAAEAVWAAIEYAPPTGMKWGRKSKPVSHCLYYPNATPTSRKYLDPAPEGDEKACIIELRCFDKGGRCLQTLAPPSRHPSGELIEFANGRAGAPAPVDCAELERAVRLTFVAALLGRHLGRAKCEGIRHEAFLALAGALARAEWPLEEAQRFLRAVYRVIWKRQADLASADKETDSTYQRFDDGGDTTGLRTFAKFVHPKVFKEVVRYLGLEAQEEMHQQAAPVKPARVLPDAEPIENLRHREILMPDELIQGHIIIPGLTVLVSPSKVGKTVFGVQMLMSCASGQHLFDNYQTGRASGLIIEWDDQRGDASLKSFLEKCRASRPDIPIQFITKRPEGLTITDPDFRPWLIRQIRQTGARIVVLDSYTALRDYRSSGGDIVKLEAKELQMLQEIAIECGCAIILIHHDSKTSAHLDVFSRAAGSFAVGAVPEAQIVMARFDQLALNAPERLISVRGRHLSGLQAVITFRETTLDYDLVMDGPASAEYPRVRQLVHSFRHVSFDAKNIQGELGWVQSTTYALMSKLTSSGIVRKVPDSKAWMWDESFRKTMEQI